MSGAIALFVKTPGLSPVKTRLAVKLGTDAAEAFHLASAQAVKAVATAASQLADIQCYYAVAEAQAVHHADWQDLPCLWQGGGGLGERMAYIYQTLSESHDFVLLVGADIPQMTAPELLLACDWLHHDEQARLAFGPSTDGGFWLFGGNCPVPLGVWTGVAYSRADTGAQFFKKIEALGEIKTLATLRDVDEAEDLMSLRQSLLRLTQPLPQQSELIGFLNTLPLHYS